MELSKIEKDLVGTARESIFEIPVDNTALLEEIAYVVHRHVVKEQIDKLKKEKEDLLKKLEVFPCNIKFTNLLNLEDR